VDIVAFGASVTGPRHRRAGKPNEDAWGKRATKDSIVLAVADGVGSCPSARRGAQCARKAALHTMSCWVNTQDPTTVFATALRQRWLALVAPTPAPQAGTTCLVAGVAKTGELRLAALGDGLAAYASVAGEITVATAARDGFANETVALDESTLPGDWRHVDGLAFKPGGIVLLATDGVSDDLQHDQRIAFMRFLVNEFGPLPGRRRWAELASELRRWPTPGHQDDKTVAVLWRRA
jgi:serine/threonine protein phosphatase PrpC